MQKGSPGVAGLWVHYLHHCQQRGASRSEVLVKTYANDGAGLVSGEEASSRGTVSTGRQGSSGTRWGRNDSMTEKHVTDDTRLGSDPTKVGRWRGIVRVVPGRGVLPSAGG